MKIAPSILAADFSQLKTDILSIAQDADWVHVDVMDGHFVPNISIGPAVVKSIRKHTDLPFDTHLMISNPEQYVDQFIDAGSDHITFHIEAVASPETLIKYLHEKKVKAGLSIKPKTSVDAIKPYLHDLDIVLVMSVEPGFGGQTFMHEMVEKMQALAALKKTHGYHYEIVVDGGINDQTASICQEAGVDVLVAGSYVFNAKNRKAQIESLK